MIGNYSIKIYYTNNDIDSDAYSETSVSSLSGVSNLTINVLTVKMRATNEGEERQLQGGVIVNYPLMRTEFSFEGVFLLPSDLTLYNTLLTALKYKNIFIEKVSLPYSIHTTNYAIKVQCSLEVNPELNRYKFALNCKKEKLN